METILLVYNDQNLSENIEENLVQEGFSVKILHDAELVEDFVRIQPPDLIVLDALLQKKNGFELCQALKDCPQIRQIPLIITSAIYISDEEMSTGIRFGNTTYPIQADHCVMKPFASSELLTQIKRLLGKNVDTRDVPQVLIVDDEPEIRDLLKTTLMQHQYLPFEAASGEECLAMLPSMTPDLILLDYKLPDMSGFDVLKVIRKTLPDVGVVLMTAYGDEDLAITAIAEHVDAYVRKPFTVATILTLLIQTLKRSRMKSERNCLVAQLRESNKEVVRNYLMLDQANRQLRELDQLKSEFLANIGHELRTPLNSIIGFTELVLQGYSGPINPEQTRQLSMVLHSGNQLLRVLNDVIEVSMLNAGQIFLKNERFALSPVINEVLVELQNERQKKNVPIVLRFEKDLPDCYCCREKTRLILYNLLDNAIKFSSSGEITLSAVSASSFSSDNPWKEHIPEHSESKHDYLLVSVQDQGIGISQKDFDILFDEFRQVDGSLTREYNGTGLGLAITKKLVELYGGEVWLESQVGVGTTFYFTVPISREPRTREKEQ